MQMRQPDIYDAYWYTRGRAEAYCDLMDELDVTCDCKESEA